MTAADTADRGRLATAEVTILVQRNANAPQFSQTTYRMTLEEEAPLGEAVITVAATDDDGVRILANT